MLLRPRQPWHTAARCAKPLLTGPGFGSRPRRRRDGEPLAFMLRPGNAGSNTASDHIAATRLTLAQLPEQARRRALVRADSGGGTPEFLTRLTRPGRKQAGLLGRVHH